ncbi:glycine cleavage system protein H [Gaoshiqia sp. Z1-71]|uniref:glycine cleavage system protein H n=1 Tax=Gaoshiqia hydrogeniformans TaxID=3290090 RepID=UPI003BF8E6A2
MDGFTYHNIFETKGIEYLVVILFLVVLVPFWSLLNKKMTVKQGKKSLAVITAGSLQIPQGLFFSRFHTWVYLEQTGLSKLGLDDLLLHFTGTVRVKPLKREGERIEKGEMIAKIVHDGKSLPVFSPVSGEIRGINKRLHNHPELLNTDPYREGWICEIKPSNWFADTSACFLAEDATQWAIRELERFKDFIAVSVMRHTPVPEQVVLQDGGELIEAPLAELPDEVWEDFRDHFLAEPISRE